VQQIPQRKQGAGICPLITISSPSIIFTTALFVDIIDQNDLGVNLCYYFRIRYTKKKREDPQENPVSFVTIGIAILLILIALAVGLSRTLRVFH